MEAGANQKVEKVFAKQNKGRRECIFVFVNLPKMYVCGSYATAVFQNVQILQLVIVFSDRTRAVGSRCRSSKKQD